MFSFFNFLHRLLNEETAMGVKDLILFALRVYLGISLIFMAQQGGMYKLNSGIEGVSKHVVANLGPPFTDHKELFAGALIAAETVVPGLVMLGFFTRLSCVAMVVTFAVACYAHLVLWKGDIDSVIYNAPNIH
eukprot:g56921.t1